MKIEMVSSIDYPQYIFYLALLALTGVGEYFKLLPPSTMVAVLGLVTGHFFGNGATKSVLSTISNNVQSLVTNGNGNGTKSAPLTVETVVPHDTTA